MIMLERVPARVRQASMIQVDAVIALATLLIGLSEYAFFYQPTPGYPLGATSVALLVAAALSLTLRRSRLWIPYLVVHACFLVTPIAHYNGILEAKEAARILSRTCEGMLADLASA